MKKKKIYELSNKDLRKIYTFLTNIVLNEIDYK